MTSISNPRSPQALAPPRGAAIAGVIFAVLMIVGLGLTRYAIPADVTKPGTWLIDPDHRNAIRLALGVVPFAGIAFLWFIGVVRSRLGEQEDKFFASVFLGSGLLFVATLFGAAAITGALVESVAAGDISSATYYFGRSMSDLLLNLFAMKMAGVFMFSTCTLGLRTAIVPRWVVYTGYACSLLLLLVIANWRWITLIFPIWMLLLSTQILLAEFRSRDVRAVAAERHQA
jgi:hypothetical protein